MARHDPGRRPPDERPDRGDGPDTGKREHPAHDREQTSGDATTGGCEEVDVWAPRRRERANALTLASNDADGSDSIDSVQERRSAAISRRPCAYSRHARPMRIEWRGHGAS
jgi:hypothetical protein